MRGADLVAQSLKAGGIHTVFALSGNHLCASCAQVRQWSH